MDRDNITQARRSFLQAVEAGDRGSDLRGHAHVLMMLQTEDVDQEALSEWMADNWPASGSEAG